MRAGLWRHASRELVSPPPKRGEWAVRGPVLHITNIITVMAHSHAAASNTPATTPRMNPICFMVLSFSDGPSLARVDYWQSLQYLLLFQRGMSSLHPLHS